MSRIVPFRCRLFIFDLDGTLIDSRADIARSVNLTLRHMRLSELPLSRITEFVGNGVHKLLQRSLRETTGSEPDAARVNTALDLFLREYDAHMLDSTRLYPGVREAMDALTWGRFAIVSNKLEGFSRKIMQRLGMADRFCAIIGGDSVAQHKPDPAPVLEAIRRCGCSASETAMIGDSATDIQSGRNAGVITCGITGGYRATDELAAAGCDILVHTVADIPPWFRPPA